MFPLPIATGYYTSEILTLAAQTCKNWIPIMPKAGALNERALLYRPGLTSFSTGVSGDFRGDVDFNGTYITVNSTTAYSVASDGTATAITGSITGSGRLSIAKNDDYVVFVNNLGDGFYYDGSTVTQITDGDFLSASTVTYVDGYFVFSEKDGTRFFLSNINDPSAYEALDRSTADERSDPITAVYVYNNVLHVAGTETTEKFNNIGGVSFPFVRINGAANSVGCYSQFTPIEVENSYAFIGGGRNEGAQVYALSGNSMEVISTPAIDKVLQEFTAAELEQAYSMVYQKDGQHCVLFTIESNTVTDRTLGFNVTSGQWFEFSSEDTDRWYAKSVVRIYNKYLCGDDGGRIGYLDDSAATDYGDTIFCEKASQPYISQDGDEYRIGKLELWCEAGLGDADTDPQIMRQFSDDLGKTWSNESWRGLGKVGEYNTRAQWRKEGLVSRNRVYRFKYSDPFKCNIMKMSAG